jgi:hypothetical protein
MLNKFKRSSQNAECRQIEGQVTAYLKGGLSSGQQRAFRQHLLACEACSGLVQEARAIDAELFESARLEDRPHLSPEASADIQERLYRRMRRALIFQRTRHATERVVAFVAVVVLLMSALTVGRPWLRFVASSQQETTPTNPTPMAPAEEEVVEEAVVTVAAATPLPRPELITAEATPEPTGRPSSNEAVVANQPVESLVLHLIEAGLENDESELRVLLSRARPFSMAGLRVWQRLEVCQGRFTADELRLRTVKPQPRLASVYIYAGQQFLGDMKFYLDDEGNWYLSYINYGSFSQNSAGCVPE